MDKMGFRMFKLPLPPATMTKENAKTLTSAQFLCLQYPLPPSCLEHICVLQASEEALLPGELELETMENAPLEAMGLPLYP